MREPLINNFSKLNDMRDAMEDILSFTAGMDKTSFIADIKTCYAVERGLIILGEAAKKITPDFIATHPELPWKQIIKMRDKIAHHYDDVDYAKIWRIVYDIIPPALPIIKNLIAALDAELVKLGK